MTQIANDYVTCTVSTITGPFLPAFDVVRLQIILAVWEVVTRYLTICTTDDCLHWGVLWPRKAHLDVYNWNLEYPSVTFFHSRWDIPNAGASR